MCAAYTVNATDVLYNLVARGAGLSVLADISARAELAAGCIVRALPE